MSRLNKEQIINLLPHREPMLLLDELYNIEKLRSATGVLHVKKDSFFVQGHFPNQPVMPGVLIVESFGQAAAALTAHGLDKSTYDGKLVFLMGVEKARFRNPVVPDCKLILKIEAIRSHGRVWKYKGEAFVNNKKMADAIWSATIVDKKVVIDIKVPENYVSILKPGLKAEITSSAFKKIFKGKIQTISSRIDPSTRSILSRVLVDNSNFDIIPGQLMTVKIIYDEINQIGVPESAVTIQGSTAFVYTVRDETAEKKNIEIGKRNFGKVSVVSGINEGDLVIIEGVSKVRNNAKIKVITPRN